MKTRICVVLAAVLAIASFANADSWSAGSGNWSSPSTWAPSVPDSSTRAWIVYDYTVTSNGTSVTSYLDLGGGGGYGWGSGTLNVTGGSLAIGTGSIIGLNGGAGTLNISGGAVTAAAGYTSLGYGGAGTIHMTAGTLAVAGDALYTTRGAGDVVNVNLSGTAAMSVTTTMVTGMAAGTAHVNVGDNATMSLATTYLSNTTGDYSEMNLNGNAQVNAGSLFLGRYAGNGIVNVNGGKLTTSVLGIADQGGAGQLNIYGGIVQVDNNTGLVLTANGKINIASASGVLLTYRDGYAGVYSGDGRIFTSLLGYHIENENVTIDGINFTKTYAIPEPATMAMLGLGALFFRKKRA